MRTGAVTTESAALALALLTACGGLPPPTGDVGAQAPGPTAAAAAAAAPRAPVHVPPGPLDVSPAAAAFARAPRLQAKVAKSPFSYFRFINGPFSTVVCAELGDFGGTAPTVPLHGDAHVEQYALTDVGRGLTDYDDAATGPAVVDLARMVTSLRIASRMRGFSESTAVDAFLAGYREGLRGESAPAPRALADLRKRFRSDPEEFLRRVDAMMLDERADPALAPEEMRETLAEVERELRARGEAPPAPFFGIKRLGTFRAGVGSALERKFLTRLEGATPQPGDDRIVEVKFVGDRERASCVRRRFDFDPRYLREDIPPGALERFLDPVYLGAKNAWAQEWYPNFVEVEVETIADEASLAEIARDAGSLLGREHVRGASPDNLAIDATREERLREASADLADRVEASWRRFRERTGAGALEVARE